MALDEFAEFFAVFIAHVYEFDAAAVRADVADHGGETDLAETGANLKLDRVAHTEFPGGRQIGAAQANGLYPSKARRFALDLCTKRRAQRNPHLAARGDLAGACLCRRSQRRHPRLERRTVLADR